MNMTDYWKSKNKENKSFDRFMMCGLSIVAGVIVVYQSSVFFFVAFVSFWALQKPFASNLLFIKCIYLNRNVRSKYFSIQYAWPRRILSSIPIIMCFNRSVLGGILACPQITFHSEVASKRTRKNDTRNI